MSDDKHDQTPGADDWNDPDERYDPVFHESFRRPTRPSGQEPLTLALLEDLAAVLHQHGYPALHGYALAELTGTLFRIRCSNN